MMGSKPFQRGLTISLGPIARPRLSRSHSQTAQSGWSSLWGRRSRSVEEDHEEYWRRTSRPLAETPQEVGSGLVELVRPEGGELLDDIAVCVAQHGSRQL